MPSPDLYKEMRAPEMVKMKVKMEDMFPHFLSHYNCRSKQNSNTVHGVYKRVKDVTTINQRMGGRVLEVCFCKVLTLLHYSFERRSC